VTKVPIGQNGPSFFAPSADAMWVTNVGSRSVARLDPQTNRVIQVVRVGPLPGDGAVAPDGTIWIPNRGNNTVSVVDPAAGAVTATIPVGERPFVLWSAFGAVWVPHFGGDDIWRFDVD
jgi:YVTN family beta-propeller protein